MSRSADPPHNPGLRELIAQKRRWSARDARKDAEAGFQGWHERGYLPHRDEPGLTQFVTFRLADAFPASCRSEWSALLEIERNADRRRQLEAYLDLGRGSCCLRLGKVAEVIDSALRHFHGRRYELRSWVIMPNHVHVLFKITFASMTRIVGDWKRFTAREVNPILRRSGPLWHEDYWDTYMRNSAHELKAVRYIENNPVKGRLVRSPEEWPWSSARFRGKDGRLLGLL